MNHARLAVVVRRWLQDELLEGVGGRCISVDGCKCRTVDNNEGVVDHRHMQYINAQQIHGMPGGQSEDSGLRETDADGPEPPVP